MQGAPTGRPTTRASKQQQIVTKVQPARKSFSGVTPSTTRLSISASSSSKSPAPTLTSQQVVINQLLTRVSRLEEISSTLVGQVNTLCATVESLNLTVAEQREVIKTLESTVAEQQEVTKSYETLAEASANGVSVEQENISSNIVIRGLDVDENTPEDTLIEVFERICTHIGIEKTDFAPTAAEILPASSSSKFKANRPFIVKLASRTVKQKFLQARRTKFDIRPSEIKHKQTSNKPLIISEHLTKENQKLFSQARSLRGRDKFKFVWTSHGQILARRKKKSSVIRIRDESDVERLESSLRNSNGRTQPRPPRQNSTQE